MFRFSLYLLLANVAFASETTLDNIVVSGTLTDKQIEASPIAVEVITAQEIAQQGAVRLNDILSSIGGINLIDQHGEQGQSIMMQGMDSQHVLVMINGVALSQTSGEINTQRLALSNVSRIEILPGGASALYGSKAMAGVINIITKENDKSYFSGQIGLTKIADVKSKITSQAEMSINNGVEIGSSFLDSSILITRYSGADKDPETFEEEIASGYRWNINEKLSFDKISLTANWLGGRLQRPFEQMLGPNNFEKIKTENSNEVSIIGRYKEDEFNGLAELNYDHYQSLQDLKIGGNEFSRLAQELAYGVSANWIKDWGLVYGLKANYATLHQKSTTHLEVDDASSSSIEVFAQHDWFVNSNLELISGVRGQWNEGFGQFVSPKVSARWDWLSGTNHSLYMRGSIGIGYRTPSLKELYYLFDHSQYGYRVLGNNQLEPESSTSSQLEFGGNVLLGGNEFDWSLLGFQQNVVNLIDTVLEDSSALDTYRYQNTNKALINGVELKTELPVYVNRLEIKWNSYIQWLNAVNNTTDETLENRPDYINQQSLSIKSNSKYKPSIKLNHKSTGPLIISGAKQLPYTLLNATGLFELNDKLSVQFGINNILNIKRDDQETIAQDNLAIPEFGRTYRITMTLK